MPEPWQERESIGETRINIDKCSQGVSHAPPRQTRPQCANGIHIVLHPRVPSRTLPSASIVHTRSPLLSPTLRAHGRHPKGATSRCRLRNVTPRMWT